MYNSSHLNINKENSTTKKAWTIITVATDAGNEMQVLEELKKVVEDTVVGKVLEEPIKMMISIEKSNAERYYVNLLVNREINTTNKINGQCHVEHVRAADHLEVIIKYMNFVF